MTRSTQLLAATCGLGLVLFLLAPWSLQQKLFAIPYGLDPQRPAHTYFLGSRQLPLEARKLGMFAGFLIAYAYMLALGRGRAGYFPARRIVVALVVFTILMALDGANATLFDLDLPHLYTPDLRLRLASGLLMGIAMATLLLPAVSSVLWSEMAPLPSLANWREVAISCLLALGFFVVVDARQAILYYPVSLVGVGGLLLELALINLVFVLAIGRRSGEAQHARDAIPALLAALLLSAVELLFMSFVHYLTLGDLTNAL